MPAAASSAHGAAAVPNGRKAETAAQARSPRGRSEGRLLLFWGFGERAPAGPPVVIDFAKTARGQVPPGLFAARGELAENWEFMAL